MGNGDSFFEMKAFSTLIATILMLLNLILPITLFAQESIAKIRVIWSNRIQVETPGSIALGDLPELLTLSSLRLEEIRGSQRIPVPLQLEKGNPSRFWWILTDEISTESERIFELKKGKQISMPFVESCMDGEGLEFSLGEAKALRYNYGVIPPPESHSSLYSRSGFVHPIWTPKGKVMTRIHPSDHIHHLGFWLPWTKTEFEGRNVDFWNLGDGQGTVRFVRFTSLDSGPVFAQFEAIHEHIDFTTPGGEKVVLHEVWNVRLWNCSGSDKTIWMWDFTTKQSCATDEPLTLLKYRYGGFGFRGTSDWNENNSDYLTSEGKNRTDGNGTRARWCQVYGQTDAGPAGVVFLSHTENHEHPEPMRIWPSGDVFFGFCPVVYADWKLMPGNEYVRRYRVLVYDGKLTADEIEKYWQAFTDPPRIEVEWVSK